MKNLLVLVFTLFLLIPISSAYILFVGDCDDSGSIEIYSTQNIEGKVYASKDRKEWFHVPGEWTSDLKFFNSEDMVLNDNFRYGIKIEYGGFNHSFDTYCPGYKFSCKELEISTESCYQQFGYFYARFKSENHNGVYNLRYSFETDKNNIYTYGPLSKSTIIKNLTIKNLGDDNYLLKLKTDLNIERISISHDKCYNKNDKYYTYAEEYCNKSFCILDTDCGLDEYCDRNDFLCKKLECDICEIIVNHSCVEKCDDNNPCTTNECIEGQCKFTVIDGCPSDSQCFSYGDVKEINNVSSYCSANNQWMMQKQDNEICENSYECINSCINNICVELRQKNFFQRIISFFAGIFRF